MTEKVHHKPLDHQGRYAVFPDVGDGEGLYYVWSPSVSRTAATHRSDQTG
jgi:hypothetical protein